MLILENCLKLPLFYAATLGNMLHGNAKYRHPFALRIAGFVRPLEILDFYFSPGKPLKNLEF